MILSVSVLAGKYHNNRAKTRAKQPLPVGCGSCLSVDIWAMDVSACERWDFFGDCFNGNAHVAPNAVRRTTIRYGLEHMTVAFNPVCFTNLRGRDRDLLSHL